MPAQKDEPKHVSMWRGRPITDLTRDELIEVIETLGRAMQNKHEPYSSDIFKGIGHA